MINTNTTEVGHEEICNHLLVEYVEEHINVKDADDDNARENDDNEFYIEDEKSIYIRKVEDKE